MKQFLLAISVTIFLAGQMFAQQKSDEELAVRMAYTKLMFAAENGTLLREVNRNHFRVAKHEQQLSAEQVLANVENARLSFELTNFKSGKIQDLATTPYETLLTKPTGEPGVAIGGHSQGYRSNGSEEIEQYAADASWNNWLSSGESWDWNIPAKPVLDNMENHESYSRFATFDVTVHLEGKSRSYHAVTLFGSDGKEPKQFDLDMITAVRNLHDDAASKYYPAVLLTERWRALPGVTEWLQAHASEDCPSGQVCCDPVAMKCMLPKVDIDAPPTLPRRATRLNQQSNN